MASVEDMVESSSLLSAILPNLLPKHLETVPPIIYAWNKPDCSSLYEKLAISYLKYMFEVFPFEGVMCELWGF